MTHSNLANLWLHLNLSLCSTGKWRMLERLPHTVTWKPWGAWGPVGFGERKLDMLRKWYFNEAEIDRARAALDKATAGHWDPMFSIAVQMGNGLTPGSPLRYKQGQCMMTVILRVDHGVIFPLIVWRTTEVTRRLIADWVIIEQLFRRLDIPDRIGQVDMLFNMTFLANFHCALLEKWVPGISKLDPQGPAKYHPTKTPPKYQSRKIAWDLAAKARPMFQPVWESWVLLDDYMKSDFPKEPNRESK